LADTSFEKMDFFQWVYHLFNMRISIYKKYVSLIFVYILTYSKFIKIGGRREENIMINCVYTYVREM